MAAATYLNQAQQRVLHTLAILIDRGDGGALPGEIADTIGTLPSNTTRDLANLCQAGFARSDGGRWYSSLPGARGTCNPGRTASQRHQKSLRQLPETSG